MKEKDLVTNYVNQGGHERKIGRYWFSEVNSIKGGWKKPIDFLQNSPIDIKGCRMICTGKTNEAMWAEIFRVNKVRHIWDNPDLTEEEEKRIKKEIQINDEIVLVGKPDFLFLDDKDEILWAMEMKHAFASVRGNEIPARYQYQLECEYRALLVPIRLGIISTPLRLRTIPFTPSTRRWNNIKKIIVKYHEEVKKIAQELEASNK